MRCLEHSLRYEHGPYGIIAVFTVESCADVVLYALDVLQNHIIPSILPVYFREQFGSKQLCIDCTGCIPIPEAQSIAWTGVHQKKTCVADFLRAILDAEDHFLDLDSLVIEVPYVFFDSNKCKLNWCCLPIQHRDGRELDSSSNLSYEKLELLLMDPFFSDVLDENNRNQIICLLRERRDNDFLHFLEAYESPSSEESQSSEKRRVLSVLLLMQLFLMTAVLTVCIFFHRQIPEFPSIEVWTSWYSIIFGMILILNLVILRSGKTNTPSKTDSRSVSGIGMMSPKEILFPVSNVTANEIATSRHSRLFSPVFLTRKNALSSKIAAPKRPVIWVDDFLIGRDRSLCDLFLDHPSISDRHARILHRNPLYYLMDVGSNTGTYIGNRRLYSHEESPLTEGDIISFGNIQYQFSQNTSNTSEQ